MLCRVPRRTPEGRQLLIADRRIPLSIPHILGNEGKYLAECVETNWVSTRGPFVDRFERELAGVTGAQHVVACASGSAALHVALLVAGVEANDEVLVSDLTFIASAAAIKYCNAWPVLIDAEPLYWQMDPQKLADFLQRECHVVSGRLVNRTSGRRVRAVMPVHVLGHPCDMNAISDLARRYELPVVADAAEAMGTTYDGKPAAALADVAGLSFNGNKIITSGGGGAVVTNDERLSDRARYLTTQAKDDDVEFVHGAVGFNYRLTNLQAAFGVAQLEKLDVCLESKRKTSSYYAGALRDLPLTLPSQAPLARSSWWLYTVLVDESRSAVDRRTLMKTLADARIETRPLWRPVSQQTPYADCQAYHCDVSADLHRRSLSLPCSVGITDDDLSRVVAMMKTTLMGESVRA
jgi:perosamine synthetase